MQGHLDFLLCFFFFWELYTFVFLLKFMGHIELIQMTVLSFFFFSMWTSGYFRTTCWIDSLPLLNCLFSFLMVQWLVFVWICFQAIFPFMCVYYFSNKNTVMTTQHCSWFWNWIVPVFDFYSSLLMLCRHFWDILYIHVILRINLSVFIVVTFALLWWNNGNN